jgi:hypothetical protein
MDVKINIKEYKRKVNVEGFDTSCSSCSWNKIGSDEDRLSSLSASADAERVIVETQNLAAALEKFQR